MTTFNAEVVFDNASVVSGTLALKPGVNLRTGESSFRSAFGTLSSIERDLLVVASSIFACDLAFKRGEIENLIRKIRLRVPVVNYALFNSLRDDIRYAIFLLSHDGWDIEFTPLPGTPEKTQTWPKDHDSKVLLFSGGLDSFAGAASLAYSGQRVQLVSHVTGNQSVFNSQKLLFNHLDKSFSKQFMWTGFRAGGTNKQSEGYIFPADQFREESQRTRSFLFLSLAGLVARRIATKDVVMMAENGQLAIHLPLTVARISAFSTHTAHPEFIDCMKNILSAILSFDINISNPFLYLTKGEVVKALKGNEVAMIPSTVSCWMSARVTGGYTHCGECVPCIIRRIANEHNAFHISEYKTDVLSENLASLSPDDKGKRNLIEVAELVKIFQGSRPQAEIIKRYPDLINDSIDLTKAINMYRRFALEASSVFSKYSNLTSILR